MKTLTKFAIGLILLANSLCFARPPECDPGPHGCDNKALDSSLVPLSPFKIGDKKGTVYIVVNNKGEIKWIGEAKSKKGPVSTISKDGRVVDAHGKLLAVLRDTSILEDSSGTPLVRILADGTLDNGSGVLVSWTKNGTLKQGDSLLDVRLMPANSPARRAASIVFFLASSFGSPTIEEIPQTVNKSMDSVISGKPSEVTKDAAGLPTPLSVCVDQAGQRFSACTSNGVFTQDTCQAFYQQSVNICYKTYK